VLVTIYSVEIPYDPEIFNIDMRHNYEAEHVFEREYEKGYEWCIFDYSKDKLVVAEETGKKSAKKPAAKRSATKKATKKKGE
jgi:hypothetical protein